MFAIVLSRNNTRELDQMVSLYTREQGKVEVLAKGIKKIVSKNSANLKVFSLVDVEVAKGKGVDHLTKVQSINIFRNIYNDFDKIFVAGYIIKIADNSILVGEKDERIFDLLLSFLEFLNSAVSVNSFVLVTGFVFKLWHCLGFGDSENKYSVWLESSWADINNLKLTKQEALNAYEAARNFAQHHAGVKLAEFIESDRIMV